MQTLHKLMLRNRQLFLRTSILLLTSVLCVSAASIDFESFTDGEPVTNQIFGVQFMHTTVIAAGVSLNEFEFPPRSGSDVAFDDGGPITLTFASPITGFEGYFTYTVPLTLKAFGAANTVVASATSRFANNEMLSGDPQSSPNEFLQVNSSLGISKVTLTADPAGGSFVMDDLSFTEAPGTTTPEPDSIWLIGAGLVFFLFTSSSRRDRSEPFNDPL